MTVRGKFLSAMLIALLAASYAFSQNADLPDSQNTEEPQSRMEQIVEQQKEKARNLVPAEPDPFERELRKYVGENPLNRYLGGIPGLHLRFGGLPKGAGLGLGPEYLRPDLARGQVSFRASAVGSTKLWYRIETELRLPHLARRYLDLSLKGHHLNANSIDYYGPGPESDFHDEECTRYQREETALDASLRFRPTPRYLNIGISLGHQWLNVESGNYAGNTCLEQPLPPGVEPELETNTDYLVFGPFLEIDSRDKPKDPHSGTHFLTKLSYFIDREHDHYSFRQVDMSLEQYWPFFNQKRVIALRVHSVLGYPDTGHEIPFYMQSTLGGSSDLRGYRRYRFHDNNLILFSTEYRWEVFTVMDAAIFMDAGKVFHRDGDFSLQNLESNAGFGFRFKTRKAVVFRIDNAFSHEGYGLWFAFDHVY